MDFENCKSKIGENLKTHRAYNANIRDVVVGDFVAASGGGTCLVDAAKTIGGSVVVDGGCWTHSHPHEKNVYVV